MLRIILIAFLIILSLLPLLFLQDPKAINSMSNIFTESVDVVDESSESNLEPINARLDHIWKAIPGYDGCKLSQSSSACEPVKPKVSLEELLPAPIYRGNPNKRAVALMINVSWGGECLDGILKILKSEGVKATFFLEGSWLIRNNKENVALGRNIIENGHEIGNHGYSHALLSKCTNDKIEDEIARTDQAIRENLGPPSNLFAPPAGDFDDRAVKIAYKHNLKSILWLVDTIDWRPSSTPDLIINRVKSKITPGALVLMHPKPNTVKALPSIIKEIKERKLKILTVSEVLSSKCIRH